MKRSLSLLLLVCIGFVCGVGVAEVALRWRYPQGIPLAVQWGIADTAVEERAGIRADEPYGTMTYDENGFRIGTGLPYTHTVLFVGDSFTEGYGVGDEDTFARAAEVELRRAGIAVRSLNAGHRGFGTVQELNVLRRTLARFPVDAVVLQAFPMNDLSDNLAHGGFAYAGGKLIEYSSPEPPLRARLAEAISKSRWRQLYAVVAMANAIAERNGPAPFDSPTAFELERELLAEIARLAEKNGAALVVLLVPTPLVQERYPRPSHMNSFQAAEVTRFERVQAMARELNLTSINAGEVVEDLAADAMKADGSHFSKEGNAQIGAAVAARLKPLLMARLSRSGEQQKAHSGVDAR